MIESVSMSENVKNGRTDLVAVFHEFNLYTQRLEEAYNRLQCRVKEIDKEMAYTNDCLKNKVHELDNLTKYLNGLLGSIHSGVIAVNLKSEITTFNRASEKILKLQAVDVLGKKVETIFRNESNCKPLLLMALEEGENYIDVERKVETTEGLFKWIESSVSLIKDANENVIGAVEVFRDLSEIRELEMRLRHADKLATIGAMAACIAHEIRNPLNGIEGFSSLLARDFDDADPRKKLVKNIIQGTKNLNKTVTELLVFARPLKLKLSRNSISEIADKTLFFITEDMKQKGIQNIYVQKNYDLDDDTVVCDPEKLQQAFLNICMNAVQSMKNGGELVVSVRLERNVPVREVQIVIRDTGIGIKKDIIHKIFDPFFTTKQEGTGLGLAIVNRTIEAHNGKISMESVEGKGTAFFINLPRNCSYDRQIIDDAFLEEEFLSQRAF